MPTEFAFTSTECSGRLDKMAEERFRRSLFGNGNTITSSVGYRVTIGGRYEIIYEDGVGEISIFAEPLGGRRIAFDIDSSTIPEVPGRPRQLVLDRVAAAFAYAGWRLLVD